MSLPLQLKNSLESKRGRPLTELQESFLECYYASDFDVKKATKKAGIKPGYTPTLVRSLKKEMLELIEIKLVENAGDAINTMHNILVADTPIPNISTKLEAAKTVLDRIGVTKKERIEVEHKGEIGLFVLPPKQDVQLEEAVIEGEYERTNN